MKKIEMKNGLIQNFNWEGKLLNKEDGILIAFDDDFTIHNSASTIQGVIT